MFVWIIIIASSVLMYRVAEMERLSGLAWALITFGLCLACAFTIPLPLINAVIGLVISFIAMSVYNAKYGQAY